jgi:hypothetical protein
MSPFSRIGWILLVFWAALPISASAQSADDIFNALGRVLRQIPDAGNQPPPPAQTARQPDRRVVPADPAPQYQAQQYQAPRYAWADVLETPQRILNELGYDSGPVDGGYGGRTRRALIAFQQDEGLPANGEISDQVLNRLRQSSGRAPGRAAGRAQTAGDPPPEQGGCTQIRFARGTSAAEITDVAPAEGVLCYSLATLSGQTA